MLYIVKPFLKRIGDLYSTKDNIGKTCNGHILLLLIISSMPLKLLVFMPFGGFMMGNYMPDITKFERFYRKVEDVSVILLLPLFFVFYRFTYTSRG
jgi:Kef-type K+ transport system membrane component KefB